MRRYICINHSSMRMPPAKIDFSPYKSFDRTDATIGMYKLLDALDKDLEDQGRGGLKGRLKTYNDNIHNAYHLSNKASVRKAAVFGKQLSETGDMSVGGARNSGEDLAKAIAYLLVNEGRHDWANVKRFVRDLGKPFTNLLGLPPLTNKATAEQKARQLLRNLGNNESSSISAQLRAIAKQIEPYEAERIELARALSKKEEMLIRTATENKKLLVAIETMQLKTDEFIQRIELESDPKVKTSLLEQFSNFQQEFRKVLSSVGFVV